MPFLKKGKRVFVLSSLLILVLISGFKLMKNGKVVGLHHPESAYPYGEYIYVSNIGSSPVSVNKDGFITKLDRYGNILEFKFIEGLEAPKGIYAYKNRLYIADLTRLCIANLNTKKVVCKSVKGAKFLNDLVVTTSGVYITDTLKNCIFKFVNGKFSIFFKEKGLSPNGIVFLKRRKVFLVVSFNKPVVNEISLGGRLIKEFYLKGLTGFDGISVENTRVFLSDYRTGKIVETNLFFRKYKIIRDLGTPVADILVKKHRIFLPLIIKDELLIGNLR